MSFPFTADTPRQVFIQALCFLPVLLVLAVMLWKRRTWSAKSEVPFREMRRRPAGESLRLKIAAFDDKISNWAMYLVGFPAVIGLAGGLTHMTRARLEPRALFSIFGACSSIALRAHT